MIKKLDVLNYDKVLNILNPSVDNIEVKSVIKNYCSGSIFVDDETNPKTAIIWSKGIRGFYFVGDKNNNKFNDYLLKFIYKELKSFLIKENVKYFEFSGETYKWDKTFENIFAGKNINKSQQFIYNFNESNWIKLNNKKISKEYQLFKVNKNLFNKPFSNLDFLLEEIILWWDNLENFLNRSYGYIVSHNNKIVSYALGNYLIENIHLIGVETLKNYRKKGLSQACCEAFIKNSLSNNIKPRWECMGSNIASQKLVEKLGFDKLSIYNLYSFKI